MYMQLLQMWSRKTFWASVSVGCSSRARLTGNIEEEVNSHEQRLHQHWSRAEVLQVHIEADFPSTSHLEEARASYAQDTLIKEEAADYFVQHNEWLMNAASFQSNLD
jgi:hypothetical protein